MVSPKPTLLLTRPRAASERFITQLPKTVRARLLFEISPLMRIEPIAGDLDLDGLRGLIFSSANAVQHAISLVPDRGLPCYCVGRATTGAAQDAGWTAHFAGQTADELVTQLPGLGVSGPLLHLSGAYRRGEIAERLSAAGLPCRASAIYDQRLCPLSDRALSLLKSSQLVIVPLFSPRTAGQFGVDLPKGAKPHLIAMSEAVLDAVPDHLRQQVLLASQPDAAGMAEQVEKCVNRLCRVEGIRDAQ